MLSILVVAGLTLGHEPEKAQATSYQIDGSLFQGDPRGSRTAGTIKCLAEPRMRTQAGSPVTFIGGAQMTVFDADGKSEVLTYSLSVKLTPTPGPDGTNRVAADFTLTEAEPGLGIVVAGKVVPGYTQKSVHTALEMKPGEMVRQRVAARSATDQTWAEVTVRPVE